MGPRLHNGCESNLCIGRLCSQVHHQKITGKNSEEHYSSVDETTGEIFPLQPEYITMSRRPGIGKGWYDKFKTDVYPWDEVILQGKRMKPPKFYASLLEAENKLVSDQIKAKRKNVAKKRTADNTPRRLSDRGTVQSLKQKTIIRKYENAK